MKTPPFWREPNLLSTLLTPLSYLYQLGASIDHRSTTANRAPLPVISIGNVTAGGAGKTPTTLALVPMLREMGFNPHILTRGYKGAALTAHRVTANDGWQQVGDEALLLAQAAPTWVGRDRFAAANAAANTDATILVCDDALQHHALQKNLSLLVIDGPYGLGNAKLLPAGPLREPFANALSRCDAAILIGDDTQQLTSQIPLPVFRANLRASGDTSLLKASPWIAFAGIGRPEKFYTSLRELGANVIACHDFPDHHAYCAADIVALLTEAQNSNAKLITTAKDWVKLPAELAKDIRTLEVALTFEDEASLRSFLQTRLQPGT